MSVINAEPASRTLWTVSMMYGGGRTTKIEHAVWSDTPDAANQLAIKQWARFDKQWMDNCDNVDGSATKPGEAYQGFACIECGADSLMINVDTVVYHEPNMTGVYTLGTNLLKKVLKSRGIDTSTAGLKGNAAKNALADRLKGYAAPPPKDAPAAAAAASTSTSTSTSTTSTTTTTSTNSTALGSASADNSAGSKRPLEPMSGNEAPNPAKAHKKAAGTCAAEGTTL
eukprot:CAMPEP_0119499912 /NCGR_PEP_ID=MMETSP1344-20130328/22223_1 /TAXON_ID=236787 /ORGANISM="Florenciella parvula, Strain CCMP2471" /LENGTH=226 /DNA_ID=CAMNT_0007535957 /DNA_START=27 /DNA_END=707 /DNA_ORIENTATION=+